MPRLPLSACLLVCRSRWSCICRRHRSRPMSGPRSPVSPLPSRSPRARSRSPALTTPGSWSSPASTRTAPSATSRRSRMSKVEPAGIVEVQDGLFLRPEERHRDARRASVGGKQASVSGHGRGDGDARAGQLPPRRDRRAERRRLQRRAPATARRAARTASSSRSAASTRPPTTCSSPATVRPPHRQARPGAQPDAAEGRSAACRTKAASASARPACPAEMMRRVARRGAARTTRRRCPPVKKVEVLPGSRVLKRPGEVAATRRRGARSPTAASATSPG